MEPGRPLGFLDHHIKCGNSLLGTTPALLSRGIPDDAFKPIEGDDKKVCGALKKQNKEERDKGAMGDLFAHAAAEWSYQKAFDAAVAEVDAIPDDDMQGVDRKQAAYEDFLASTSYVAGKRLHDAWCAAFVCRKTENAPSITQHLITDMQRDPNRCPEAQRESIDSLAGQYQFFHWHIEFPDVFDPLETFKDDDICGWTGGFDCTLGNPPWERLNLEARQFFAMSRPDIAGAPTTARRKLIAALETAAPELYESFQSAQRASSAEIAFAQRSGRYPRLHQARLNTYSLFVEIGVSAISSEGRSGLVVPSGVATDDVSRLLFAWLMQSGRLVSLHDFENRKRLFESIDSRMKFCLLTLQGSDTQEHAATDFMFFAHDVSDLSAQQLHFTLTQEELQLLNPITGLCPTFRSSRHKGIVTAMHRAVPPFIAQKGAGTDWRTSDYLIMFRSAESSHLYVNTPSGDGQDEGDTASSCAYVPVWESKLIHQYDHRYASYAPVSAEARKKGQPETTGEDQRGPEAEAAPRYWVDGREVWRLLTQRHWQHCWLTGYRDITNATNERTAIASLLPLGGAAQPLNLFLPESPAHALCWVAAMNSFALDFVARQMIGGVHLNITTCRQLPIPGPNLINQPLLQTFTVGALELSYSSWSMAAFGRDSGHDGPPFRWDDQRRFLLRCELDAAFFHFYGVKRNDVDYIMETFPIVKRKDEAKYGDYRTKLTILQMYDEMAEAMASGKPYQTHLDPPPADPSCRHPKLKLGILAYGSLINDPGEEITPKIKWRLKTQTPFPVEYGRFSQSRGGAPTVVPHDQGAPVEAEILVLDDDVTIEEAQNMLWRRETRNEVTGKPYPAGTSPNSVVVKPWTDNPCVEQVLYTDFHDGGKESTVTAEGLAKQAIASVAKAAPGKDGITYLRDNIAAGIHTPLTDAYRDEILKQTNTASLDEGLDKVRNGC